MPVLPEYSLSGKVAIFATSGGDEAPGLGLALAQAGGFIPTAGGEDGYLAGHTVFGKYGHKLVSTRPIARHGYGSRGIKGAWPVGAMPPARPPPSTMIISPVL